MVLFNFLGSVVIVFVYVVFVFSLFLLFLNVTICCFVKVIYTYCIIVLLYLFMVFLKYILLMNLDYGVKIMIDVLDSSRPEPS